MAHTRTNFGIFGGPKKVNQIHLEAPTSLLRVVLFAYNAFPGS